MSVKSRVASNYYYLIKPPSIFVCNLLSVPSISVRPSYQIVLFGFASASAPTISSVQLGGYVIHYIGNRSCRIASQKCNMAADEVLAPALLDLTIDNITPNAIKINSQGKNQRLKYVMERLVTHIHDFARETRISTEEWMAGLNFLVQTGQISSDVRHVSPDSAVYFQLGCGTGTMCDLKRLIIFLH